MFQVADKIVHPMHGAGVIEEIVTRKINGVTRDYFILKLSVGEMLVMIPTDNCEEIGVRHVMEPEAIRKVLDAMGDMVVEYDSNWNRRYRENMARLKSGDLYEVAKVLKSLKMREGEHGLSTGEQKMLHSAKQILISEVVLSGAVSVEEAETCIERSLT